MEQSEDLDAFGGDLVVATGDIRIAGQRFVTTLTRRTDEEAAAAEGELRLWLKPDDDAPPWWTRSATRAVFEAVRFIHWAQENDGLAAEEMAPKIQDWADSSSGPAAEVYAAVAAALRDQPADAAVLNRPERERRRVDASGHTANAYAMAAGCRWCGSHGRRSLTTQYLMAACSDCGWVFGTPEGSDLQITGAPWRLIAMLASPGDHDHAVNVLLVTEDRPAVARLLRYHREARADEYHVKGSFVRAVSPEQGIKALAGVTVARVVFWPPDLRVSDEYRRELQIRCVRP